MIALLQGLLYTGVIAFAAARSYSFNQSFSGENFFDNFAFYTGDDPTHGFVDFVSYDEATDLNMISYDNTTGLVYVGAEYYSYVSTYDSRGRKAVRLESHYQTSGDVLIIIDLTHMPTSIGHLADGCGTWPAFWSFGPDWPNSGEIDIIEYANCQTADATTLHTSAYCDQSQEDPNSFTGTWGVNMYGEPGMNCDVNADDQWENAGCGIIGTENSVGSAFNNQGGGVFALEWVSDTEIQSYYFTRDSIPEDITKKNPNPAEWGLPYARFEVGQDSDCSSDHFKDHKLIFDLTFCGIVLLFIYYAYIYIYICLYALLYMLLGDWAGSTFNDDCQTGEWCNDYVAYNPSYFEESYWRISYVDIYDIA